MRRIFAFLILLQPLVSDASAAQPDVLFLIARSTNGNVVQYVANLTHQGGFDKVDPISARWVMTAEDGHQEKLTGLEKRYAYGFTVLPDATGSSLNLKIKAMENIPISVAIVGDVPRAEAEIAGHMANLQRVFVQLSGWLFPEVETITLSGVEVDTGKKIEEVIRP